MKRLGLIALLIPILIIAMGFVDTTDGSITPDMEIEISSIILVNSIAEDITIQDLLNVEFSATYQTEAKFVTAYIYDQIDEGICFMSNIFVHNGAELFADVEYIYIGDILPSDGLRLSTFL